MARRHTRWFFGRVRQKSGKAFAQLHFKKKAASDKQFYSGAKDLKTIKNIKLQNCAYMSLPLQLNGFFTSTQSPITSDFFNQTFPLQYFNIAKHRNHLSNGPNITQLVEKLRTQEKVCLF